MKKKGVKIFSLGMVTVLALSMLVGCSSGNEGSKVNDKNNIVIDEKYVITEKDEKYGLMDLDKKQVIKNKYDSLYYLDVTGLFDAEKNGKYGVIDKNEKEIIPYKYESVNLNNAKDKIYATDYKTTTIFSLDGKKEKTMNYGFVWDTKEGTAIVGKNVIETENDLSIDCGLIDESGNVLLKAEYEQMFFINDYNEETKINEPISIYAEKGGKAGIYSLKGDVIIPMEYDAYKQDERYGLYSISYNAYTQSYVVNKGDKQGVFDKKGKQILETKYEDINASHNGYIATVDYHDTAFDLKGNVLLSDENLFINALSDNGLISVTNKGGNTTTNTYYMDSNGKKVDIEGLKDKEFINRLSGFDNLGNAVITYYLDGSEVMSLVNEKGDIVIGPLKEEEGLSVNIINLGFVGEDFRLDRTSVQKEKARSSTDYLVNIYKRGANDEYQAESTSLYNKKGKKIADFNGEVKLSPITNNFYELTTFENDEKLCGVIDKSGKIVVKPSYDYVSGFYDDYIIAYKGDKTTLLDKESGKVVSVLENLV